MATHVGSEKFGEYPFKNATTCFFFRFCKKHTPKLKTCCVWIFTFRNMKALVQSVVNTLLHVMLVPAALKEAVVASLLKETGSGLLGQEQLLTNC